MASTNMEVKARHIPEQCQFVIELDGTTEKAHIDYEVIGDGKWDLQHTLVPPTFRGHGVAKVLAKAVFDHVVKEDMKMKLSCWYLKGYAEKNPSPEYCERIIH